MTTQADIERAEADLLSSLLEGDIKTGIIDFTIKAKTSILWKTKNTRYMEGYLSLLKDAKNHDPTRWALLEASGNCATPVITEIMKKAFIIAKDTSKDIEGILSPIALFLHLEEQVRNQTLKLPSGDQIEQVIGVVNWILCKSDIHDQFFYKDANKHLVIDSKFNSFDNVLSEHELFGYQQLTVDLIEKLEAINLIYKDQTGKYHANSSKMFGITERARLRLLGHSRVLDGADAILSDEDFLGKFLDDDTQFPNPGFPELSYEDQTHHIITLLQHLSALNEEQRKTVITRICFDLGLFTEHMGKIAKGGILACYAAYREIIVTCLRDSPQHAFKTLAYDRGALAKFIDVKMLKDIIPKGPHQGKSVAFFLAAAAAPKGTEKQVLDDRRLANFFNVETLNHFAIDGLHQGLYVAFFLAAAIGILVRDKCGLANLFDVGTLNKVVPDGPHKGWYVVFFLAAAIEILALDDDDCRLANQIKEETLNTVVLDGRDQGWSVAFFLAVTLKGKEILARDDGRLAKQINAETLNHIVSDGRHQGESVAFFLAATLKGIGILARDGYRLANSINAETLNKVIPEGRWAHSVTGCQCCQCISGPDEGLSVVFCLAARPEGIAILALDDGRLIKMINAETLNHIVSAGPQQGKSVAFFLAIRPEGIAILALDDGRLAKQINAETLNAVVSAGADQGKSVAFCLAARPEGIAILRSVIVAILHNYIRDCPETLADMSCFLFTSQPSSANIMSAARKLLQSLDSNCDDPIIISPDEKSALSKGVLGGIMSVVRAHLPNSSIVRSEEQGQWFGFCCIGSCPSLQKMLL